MRISNREMSLPIPATEKQISDESCCPCCKAGTISVKAGIVLASCNKCGQRYQIRPDGEGK